MSASYEGPFSARAPTLTPIAIATTAAALHPRALLTAGLLAPPAVSVQGAGGFYLNLANDACAQNAPERRSQASRASGRAPPPPTAPARKKRSPGCAPPRESAA